MSAGLLTLKSADLVCRLVEREIVDFVCLAVWYFLKEFPSAVRAEPPWAPQLPDPQTDLVLLTEVKESES